VSPQYARELYLDFPHEECFSQIDDFKAGFGCDGA